MDFIQQNNLTIKYVLNTHLHMDHVFGNRFLFKQFGVKPQAHKSDICLLERLQEQSLAFGVPINEEEQPLGNYIDENDILTLGESSIQFIHVPGHSQGSLCIYFKKEKGEVPFPLSLNYLTVTVTFSKDNPVVNSSAVATPPTSATVIVLTGSTEPSTNLANTAS